MLTLSALPLMVFAAIIFGVAIAQLWRRPKWSAFVVGLLIIAAWWCAAFLGAMAAYAERPATHLMLLVLAAYAFYAAVAYVPLGLLVMFTRRRRATA